MICYYGCVDGQWDDCRCLGVCLNVLVVKIKVLMNFQNPGVLPPTAERVDCCRCLGGTDKPLELPKGAVNELVHKRSLKHKSFLVVL